MGAPLGAAPSSAPKPPQDAGGVVYLDDAVLVVEGGRIVAAAFEGNGCALSRASASLLTLAVAGQTVAALPRRLGWRICCSSCCNELLLSKLRAYTGTSSIAQT